MNTTQTLLLAATPQFLKAAPYKLANDQLKMNTIRTRASLMLVLGVAFSTNAGASLVLDQTSLPAATLNVSAGFGGPYQQAQTFKAGITGTLMQLDVLGSGSGNFFVDIRGQVASHPDNAIVLQTVNVSGFASGSSYTSISLNLGVTANDLLSFVIYGGNGGALTGTTFSGYADGGLWTFGNPPFGVDGPGTWYPNGADTTSMDLAFRTFVDVDAVPVPAAAWLLGSGLLGLIGVARRKAA